MNENNGENKRTSAPFCWLRIVILTSPCFPSSSRSSTSTRVQSRWCLSCTPSCQPSWPVWACWRENRGRRAPRVIADTRASWGGDWRTVSNWLSLIRTFRSLPPLLHPGIVCCLRNVPSNPRLPGCVHSFASRGQASKGKGKKKEEKKKASRNPTSLWVKSKAWNPVRLVVTTFHAIVRQTCVSDVFQAKQGKTAASVHFLENKGRIFLKDELTLPVSFLLSANPSVAAFRRLAFCVFVFFRADERAKPEFWSEYGFLTYVWKRFRRLP